MCKIGSKFKDVFITGAVIVIMEQVSYIVFVSPFLIVNYKIPAEKLPETSIK